MIIKYQYFLGIQVNILIKCPALYKKDYMFLTFTLKLHRSYIFPFSVFQDRSRMYDSLNMHSLENSLIDIMRAEHDPLKGTWQFIASVPYIYWFVCL